MPGGSYQLNDRTCPYCDHTHILYSDRPALNFFRQMYGSSKRFCPECRQKWRLKPRHRAKVMRELMLISLAAFIGFGVFYSLTETDSPEMKRKAEIQSLKDQFTVQQVDRRTQIVNLIENKDPSYVSMMTQGKGASSMLDAVNLYKSGNSNLMSKAKNNPEMMKKAQNYMNRYQNGSDRERKQLIAEAKKRLRDLRV